MTKILLVEDDQPTAAVLSEVLTTQCYTVDVATDGEMGLELATASDYELILLDLLIPKLDGIGLCCQLRTQGIQKPILLLTAKDSSADVVRGLDAGADDYVTKPYDLSQLLARIRALLRRGTTHVAPTLLTWGNLCVNPVAAEVTYMGQTLSLSPKEYSLLGLFLRNPQRVFSRSDIIDRLWSIDASPSEGAVTNLIKDLRQKLKATGMTTDVFETVYGLGYRLKSAPGKQEAQGTREYGKGEQREDRRERVEEAMAALSPSAAIRQKGLASIDKVLKRYQDTFAARTIVLVEAEAALRSGNLSQELRERACLEAHKLAGTLGSFGYRQGSQFALAIEHWLLQETALDTAQIPQFSQLVAALKQTLAQPPLASVVSPLSEIATMPWVLVIDEDVAFTEQLKQNAFAWGMQVEGVCDWTIAQQMLAKRLPSAILLSLTLPAPNPDGITLVQTLKRRLPTVPIVVMAGQDSLAERVMVARLGCGRFLYRPITIAQIFEAVMQLLAQTQSATARVMLVDDDAIVLETLQHLLQPWGLQVTNLQDPSQFWEVLSATQPDLLVLDLEMPAFSGIDLCQVVRQDPKWGNLPILVVTAHTDMESIQQVFAAGADDFIGKPVVGPELVTRVISRIDRSRLQQELEMMKRRIGT
ncbi:MAG: response regulator [Scytolyngbya sp. HA4215-MV1]|jgi:DNA-binding response OmpR family regulator|nr:response regulator [Scytolyngbya sp. HA4215-MV1]